MIKDGSELLIDAGIDSLEMASEQSNRVATGIVNYGDLDENMEGDIAAAIGIVRQYSARLGFVAPHSLPDSSMNQNRLDTAIHAEPGRGSNEQTPSMDEVARKLLAYLAALMQTQQFMLRTSHDINSGMDQVTATMENLNENLS